jgi:CubicO group peptidase (beta-lactamase class C family)
MPEDPAAPERPLTLLQCLSHQTSLPAVEPLYLLGLGPEDLRRHVLQRRWSRQTTPVYSDINFIFLGLAIEAVTGTPLREHPLVDGLTFAPESAHCAATERCPWRGRMIRGEVHDENAFALGGVAGHAGLFGTVDGVLNFALSLLEWHRDSPVVSELLARKVSPRRTIGWERAHSGWSGGSRCSPRCIGHVGFTGTGLWIDLELGVAWTLLSNRIHPTRESAAPLQLLRPLVSDAVLDAMSLA